MSYETTYCLSWDETSPTKEELAQALAENIDGSTPGQQDYEDVTSDWMEMLEGDRTETRWESHEKDIAKISRMWPETLFMLSMRGEQCESHQDYFPERDGPDSGRRNRLPTIPTRTSQGTKIEPTPTRPRTGNRKTTGAAITSRLCCIQSR